MSLANKYPFNLVCGEWVNICCWGWQNGTDLGKCTHQCEGTQGNRFRQKLSSSVARRVTDNKRRRKQRRGQIRSRCTKKYVCACARILCAFVYHACACVRVCVCVGGGGACVCVCVYACMPACMRVYSPTRVHEYACACSTTQVRNFVNGAICSKTALFRRFHVLQTATTRNQ